MSFNLKPFAKRINNKYPDNKNNIGKTTRQLSSEIGDDVEVFLRNGGKINTVPYGVSNSKDSLPISVIEEVEGAMDSLESDLDFDESELLTNNL
jgi:hypothetical protein